MREMREGRAWHAMVLFQGQAVSMGGYDGKNALASVERYDQANNDWIPMPSFNQAKTAFAACTIGARFMFTFGSHQGDK